MSGGYDLSPIINRITVYEFQHRNKVNNEAIPLDRSSFAVAGWEVLNQYETCNRGKNCVYLIC